jgi:hypothetical protein
MIYIVEEAIAACFILVCCLAYSSTLKMERNCSSETSIYFNGMHGVTFQKIELLLFNAARTPDPTYG